MLEERHPDFGLPHSVRQPEEPSAGHLKIFFGYAAGVGKTYAMLEAARPKCPNTSWPGSSSTSARISTIF